MFVPLTSSSHLCKELQKREDKFTNVQGIKSFKCVERGGMMMRELLVKSNPFKPTHCGWEQCWPCSSPMSIPSDKPTTPGRPDDNTESIHTYFVNIFQEEEEAGQGEVGEQSIKILRKPVLRLESQHNIDNCLSIPLSRSSPDVVVAQVEE